ncbi:restriction endonuclease subunit S [Streptococcus mitis]|jgi:restriction enzyme bgcI subunit beta|uniref:restriction endonuclease subunit S n=1 Tax=Streptococcus mitis TaxID=28037 RepID=UPI0022B7C7D0|nr:restriction endonuclease subunit S [Streptococcus mitis]
MSKLTLDSVEWKEFKLIDLFDIKDGYYNKKPPAEIGGEIPFLGATQSNNGITGFYSAETINRYDKVGKVSSKDKEKRIFAGNCLAVTNNGSVGNVYYQKSRFTCSHDVTPIYLKNYKLNHNLAQFLIPLLKKSGESFEYGKKWRPIRMKKSRIQLPIDSNGNPHWQFMEDYIKQERKKQAIQIRNYYEPKMLKLAGELAGLEEVEWKEFKFTDIFTKIQRGKRLTKGNQVEGDIPYISSTATNNGVDNFISNEEKVRKFDNCLTLANSGSVGSCFYQQYEFVASDHVTALQNKDFSKGVYLFLSSVIKRLEEKYSFNREINDARISRETVILPVDTTGNPNWQYMEDYVKRLELEQLENVLEYIYIYRTISFHKDFQKPKSVEWKEFWLEDVCEIQSGIRLTQSDMTEGDRPFIGATEFNNGITAFVSNTNKSLDSNVLGVNYNGSVVKNFYHEYECVFSDDVKRLKVKDYAYQNKYVYLFLKQVILQQERKYAYGYKFNASRMKRQKIMLPVGQTGEPNYSYMIGHMKWLEFKEMYKLLSAIK